MDHDHLDSLKRTHPAWRLLSADHAPLIVSFLYKIFIEPNKRSVRHSDLVARLEDYLYHLRQIHGDAKYPRSAKHYLDEWANSEAPFLHKYYPDLGDEAEFDLTPAAEKAIEWLQGFEQKQFIGTESRLLTVFELLRAIVEQTEMDPEARIAHLEKQKAVLDEGIAKIRDGILEPFDATRIKERYYQVDETAHKLLSDFRQVEYNFRELDRTTRERIATSDQAKGEVLDTVFEAHDKIWGTDQGKSFKAFWEFLMMPERQEELQDLIRLVHTLEAVGAIKTEFLDRIKFYLLEAGEKVYKTNNLLVEQLRRFLDDQAYLENKRILEIIKSIEKQAVEVKDSPPQTRQFAAIDHYRPEVDLVMERRPYSKPVSSRIKEDVVCQGDARVDARILYQQPAIDEAALKANIRRALQERSQVSLKQLTERFPLRHGLAEVVAYLNLAAKDGKATIVDAEQECVQWMNEVGQERTARLPKVIYIR